MPERNPSPVALVVAVGGLAGLGYVGYRYWYLPNKMRQDLTRYAAQTGLAPKDALAALGKVGCQAFGAKYGLSPAASSQVCNEMSQMAAALARELPGLVGGTLTAVGGGVGAIGKGVGAGVTDIGKTPIRIAAYGADKVYGGAKTVVTDVYHGAKTVISDVGSAGSKILRGIADLF